MIRIKKKKKLFFSYCSVDHSIMDAVKDSLRHFQKDYEVFCTYDDGLTMGADRGDDIRRNLRDSDYMIAFITDSYLRSVICISEISAFWAKGATIVPIIYNGELGKEFLKQITGNDKMFFDVQTRKKEDIALELHKSIGIDINKSVYAVEWLNREQGNPDNVKKEKARPYIGSGQFYYDVIHYCKSSGIRRIQDVGLQGDVIRRKLCDKKEIYLVGTTQKAMIASNPETFIDALANGSDIYVMIADKNTGFCSDVADVESFPSSFKEAGSNQIGPRQILHRLGREFDTDQDYLSEIYFRAKERKPEQIGHIYFGCAFTLIRQTVTVGINREKNELWGWVSVTMPPKRASDGTMGFEVESKLTDEDSNHRSLVENLYEYVREIRALAEKRGTIFEINENYQHIDSFSDDFDKQGEMNSYREQNKAGTANIKKEWQNYYSAAEQRMRNCQAYNRNVLIEIAAQHPLKDGKIPDTAFAERLDDGILLYSKLKKMGNTCKIYVPGSLHKGDLVSLSKAGIQYLIESGEVDPKDIFEEDVNQKYKGSLGVYNSADECYVASRLFEYGQFGQLWCICSANQFVRKKLFYIRFGVIAKFSIVEDDGFHSDIDELFDAIPSVLTEDHDWQDPNSYHAIRTRTERMPGYHDSQGDGIPDIRE